MCGFFTTIFSMDTDAKEVDNLHVQVSYVHCTILSAPEMISASPACMYQCSIEYQSTNRAVSDKRWVQRYSKCLSHGDWGLKHHAGCNINVAVWFIIVSKQGCAVEGGGIHLAVAKFSLTTSSVCQSSFWLKGNPPPPRPCMLTTEWNETTQVSGPGTVTNKTLPSFRVLMMYFQQMQLCAHSICWMWLLWAHQTPHPLIYLCRPQKFQSVVGD